MYHIYTPSRARNFFCQRRFQFRNIFNTCLIKMQGIHMYHLNDSDIILCWDYFKIQTIYYLSHMFTRLHWNYCSTLQKFTQGSLFSRDGIHIDKHSCFDILNVLMQLFFTTLCLLFKKYNSYSKVLHYLMTILMKS